MKAIISGAACAALAVAAPDLPTPDVRIACTLLAAVAFAAFICNVGRRPARKQREQA
ncbi:hypothetical protein [Burkholderia sp. YIM B11467]